MTAFPPATPPRFVTVYSKPNCQQCKMLKAWLDARGIAYENADATLPEHIDFAKEHAILQAPFTSFSDISFLPADAGVVFGGFRVDVLEAAFPEELYPVLPADTRSALAAAMSSAEAAA